jgi:Ca2+-binding EF-hand superfamily protein
MNRLPYLLLLACLLGGAAEAQPQLLSFEELDQNGDGQLSSKEASRCPELDFAQADRDEDGQISAEEFRLAIRQVIHAGRTESGTTEAEPAPPAA